MPYVPDATQITEPTDAEKASTMGLEFRTLKTYIQSVVVPSIAGKIGNGINTLAAGTQLRFPGGAPLEGIVALDYSSFLWDTNKVIPQYGITWKAMSSGNPQAFLSAFGGISFCTIGQIQVAINAAGVVSCANDVHSPHFVATNTGVGSAKLEQGDTTHTGYVSFFGVDGTRKAYIGYGLVSGNINFTADDSSSWGFNTNIFAPSFSGHLIGNADTATFASSAGAVPWTGVSGRPTLLSQFTNDIGAGGGSGVASFNSRTGAVTLSSADVTGALGYTPYSTGNPGNFTTLAAVAAAGYQTSSGAVNSATVAGNGVNSVVNATSFTGSDTGNGNDLTDVTISLSGGVVTLTRHRSYRTAPDPGGGP